MTAFPVDFKVGITLPHRHSEFISASVSFKNGYNRTFLSHKPAINRGTMKTIHLRLNSLSEVKTPINSAIQSHYSLLYTHYSPNVTLAQKFAGRFFEKHMEN